MMYKTLSRVFRPLLVGLLFVGLSLPLATSVQAAESKSSKTSAHSSKAKKISSKSSAKKKSTANRKRSSSTKVSRYGKRRSSTPQLSAAERQRQIALANLPHRLGPTEIFQIPGAQSSLLLESRAAVVMNAETGELLYSKNPERTMPIASITKLMTAMIVLDARLPMDEPITISQADVDTLRHTTSRLAVGSTLSRGDVMLLALMSSENRAAAALARTYPGGTPAAVAAMNRKARELGMTHTHFMDSTGLHTENAASPTDLVRMVKAARNYPEIHQFSTTAEHTVYIGGRALAYHNTNALVKNNDWNIEVSKTGFINEAGKCLVMQARINATPVVIVLMDSAGRYTRIGDANRVKKWMESAFNISRLGQTSSNGG